MRCSIWQPVTLHHETEGSKRLYANGDHARVRKRDHQRWCDKGPLMCVIHGQPDVHSSAGISFSVQRTRKRLDRGSLLYRRRKVQATAEEEEGEKKEEEHQQQGAASNSNNNNNSRGRQPIDIERATARFETRIKNPITESSHFFCTSRWTRIYAAARTAGRLVGTIRRTKAVGGRTSSSHRRPDLHAPAAVR